jgi:hypothetical protein
MDPDGASFAEMNRPSTDPATDPLALDEDTAERLLAGDLPPDQAPPGYAEVAALLAATVAPPSPQELAGQAAALAELKAVTRNRSAVGARARARAAAAPRRAGKLPRRRRVGLAVALVVGALSTGGVAAAATGHLPGPIREAAHNILTTVGVAPPAAPTESGRQPAPRTGNTSVDGQDVGPPGGAGRGPDPTAAPSVEATVNQGLCRAFIAGQGAEQGKKMDATAFKALAKAAGGPDKIAGYCQHNYPGSAKPDKQKPDKPPGTPGNEENGQGGPPPDPGGGNQGQGGPPGTRPNDH